MNHQAPSVARGFFSRLLKANRFDAEFYRQEHIDFIDRIKVMPQVSPLGVGFEAFSGSNPGRGNQELSRLRQAQLTAFGVTYSGLELIENASATERATLRAGDVLIACTAHEPQYVGRRVDIVDQLPPTLEGKIVPVADVMVIRSREGVSVAPPPSFLASFMRSDWGRTQFQRLNRGVRGGHVYGQDVESFVYVPCPDAKWLFEFEQRQDKIRTARRLSIEYMTQAVDRLTSWLEG